MADQTAARVSEQVGAAVKERGARVAERASETYQGMLQKLQERSPNSRQLLGFVTLVASVITLLVLGGLALGGVLITLLLATPILIAASPILIPLGILLFLVIASFVGVGGSVAAMVSVVSWIYNYFKGRHPPGADQIDAATRRLSETVARAKDRAQGYAGYAQARVEEAAPGA